jgi:hypothetical protein
MSVLPRSDVHIAIGSETAVMPKVDTDLPGKVDEMIVGTKKPISRLRAIAISGCGRYASEGAGLGGLLSRTTVARDDGKRLPHDPAIAKML